MKTLLTLILIALTTVGFSQTDCKPYVPIEKGTQWEVTSYDKKDKVTGRTVYELLDLVEGDAKSTFSIKAMQYDDKDELIYTNEFEAWCENGKFQIDMAYMINGEQMQAYESMDVEVDATKFEVPTLDEPAGTALPDGEVTVTVRSSGVQMFKMTVEVVDRLIEGRETQTTDAGTFDCVVFSQTVKTRMIVKVEGSSKEWYAENVGVVRSESYNKKGNLTGYNVLTSITAP